MELKARGPMTPPKQREARFEELKAALAMIVLHLDDAQKLLDDATSTWSSIEEILDLMTVRDEF